MFDLAVRNGLIVTASERFHGDIGVRDGRIAQIGRDLPRADREIDATGLLVMPGGVDAHCHIEEPSYQGGELADDFAAATLGAACGGTTTIMPFVNLLPGASLRESVEDYGSRARARARIDYAFHLLLGEASASTLGQDLPALMEDGYRSVKVFMNYAGYRLDDDRILDVMAITRAHGGITMVHAENGHCVHWLSRREERGNRPGLSAFAASSPPAVEREATHRAITLSEISGARTLIVHVSAAEAIEQIRWGQARGIPVLAETCPQYLIRTVEVLERPGWDAARFLCSPPLRSVDNAAALWTSLGNGTLQLVSSDHCPYRIEGTTGKRSGGAHPSFRHVPPGLPGLETRLTLLFSEGVGSGRLTLEQFVALTATNPARIYGLYPRKGSLMPGADADIVLWDPESVATLRHADLHDDCDYTPYEGQEVRGLPVVTLSRGECVWQRGEVTAALGRGRPVERTRAA